MLTLQKAFNQLCLVTKTITHNAGKCSELVAFPMSRNFEPVAVTSVSQTVSQICAQRYSTKSKVETKTTGSVNAKMYDPPSPYRNPGPRRYGYSPSFFTGGLLPRGDDDEPIRSLPKHKEKDMWGKKKALFGQNDYIDILGNGSVKPVDLIRGPDWLIGFNGNEMQRLIRRLNFHGDKLKLLYPQKYHNIRKRIFFLYKKYNQKRGKRVTGE